MALNEITAYKRKVSRVADMKLDVDGEIKFHVEWQTSRYKDRCPLSWEPASIFKGGMRAAPIKHYARGNETQYKRLLAQRDDHRRFQRVKKRLEAPPTGFERGSCRTFKRDDETEEAFQIRVKKNQTERDRTRRKREKRQREKREELEKLEKEKLEDEKLDEDMFEETRIDDEEKIGDEESSDEYSDLEDDNPQIITNCWTDGEQPDYEELDEPLEPSE